MSNLGDILRPHVGNGSAPGAVGLVSRGGRVEVRAAGSVDVEGTSPMARDSIFRVASITKPITAAAVMMLVEDGRIALDDPVGHWLPELASPLSSAHAAGPVDDVVGRPSVTVADLLTFRAGTASVRLLAPVVGLLFSSETKDRHCRGSSRRRQ
jgi:CubicO group peptidase (beta-lactamase class C family)